MAHLLEGSKFFMVIYNRGRRPVFKPRGAQNVMGGLE